MVARIALPPIIRQKYPRFMRANISEELNMRSGASLSLVASVTALLLQVHDTKISASLELHSQVSKRPILRLLRTYLYGEMALNGTTEGKDQTASWLRWTHRHIHAGITNDVRIKLGIPEYIETHTSIDDLNAYVLETLIWSTISFQTKYGRSLWESQRFDSTRILSCRFTSWDPTKPAHKGLRLFHACVESPPRRSRVWELADSCCCEGDRSIRLHNQEVVVHRRSGRDEIVRAAKQTLDLGKDVVETSINEGTFCGQVGIPPVDLIAQTSERRTSGFFLWDLQGAELHFIDKLWPELKARNWLETSFSSREIRGGR